MSDIDQIKAQRLMIIGAISEMPEAERRVIEEARSAIVELVNRFEEAGELAMTLVTLDIAVRQAEAA